MDGELRGSLLIYNQRLSSLMHLKRQSESGPRVDPLGEYRIYSID